MVGGTADSEGTFSAGGCLMAARRGWGEGTYSYIEEEDAWVWRGYYLDPLTGTRKRKAIQAKKRPDLKQKVEQWQAEQKAGMGGARIKVKEWCHLWLHKVMADAVKPRTWDNYEMTVRNHIIPQWGEVWIDKLTTAAIQIYLSGLLNDHTARTVRTIRTHIIACFGAAVDFGYLVSNPAKKTRGPQVGKNGATALTHEQSQKLLDVAKSGEYIGMPRNDGSEYLQRCYYCVILLALISGMREGEIFALRWDKIKFRQQKVLIDLSLSNSRKAGLKISSTKTKRSNRIITLPEQTLSKLKDWQTWQKSYAKKYRGIYHNENGLVFTNSVGRPLLTSNFLNRAYKRMLKAAGILDERITFHTLRHTHASQLLSAGVNVKVVSERMGHSSVSVTMDVYAHCLPDMQETAVAALEHLYGDKKQHDYPSGEE